MYLRRKSDSAVTQNLDSSSAEYQQLAALRDPVNTQYPLWEEVAEQDIVATNPRAWVINDPGAATAANETASAGVPSRPGAITAAVLFANSPGIVGQATNSRTITVVQGTAPGAATPARTTLATLALLAGVNAPTGQASTPFTINSANFIEGAPLEVNSAAVGTGLADPGGLVIITYTPA